MLIRMLVGLSGNAYSLGPGDERDFPQDEALRLISAGFAAPVAGIQIECAVQVPAPERRGRKRNVVSGTGDSSANG
ncbi:hypothetical protein [Mesorhizobium sp. M0118]|uniref:hypothetical protein n=1 Tax=Mesorhizobium sp. M0118 TaxID=2956884 RepID=UPI00333AB751